MDKRVILSVAGSGKTSYLINRLNLEKRFLIITYTNNNLRNLKDGIIRKFEFFPENIKLFPYFTFLYSVCFRPFFLDRIKPKGIFYDFPPDWTYQLNRNNPNYYISKDKRLYHNRISKFIEVLGSTYDVLFRLEKYFDCLFIDEMQDFAGNDFNFLKTILNSRIEFLLVGDFFQHTFDTSNDGQVNINLHNDYENYKEKLISIGLVVDEDTLKNSHRCSPSICDFLRKNLGVTIFSNRNDETLIRFVTDEDEADEIFNDNKIVKLFYNEHHKYDCHSDNWGNSKGIDTYFDVCVVLNKTTYQLYLDNNLHNLKPQTKNKLYVAITRTRNNLYLLNDAIYKKFKRQ